MKRIPLVNVLSLLTVLVSELLCWGATISHDRYVVAHGLIARAVIESTAAGKGFTMEAPARLPSAQVWYERYRALALASLLVCAIPVIALFKSRAWSQRIIAMGALVIAFFLWWSIPAWRT
jgi:hypothetical protein